MAHQVAYSWRDDTRDEGGWESPAETGREYGWVEACGRALESANAHRSAVGTLTVEAWVKPCQLGCFDIVPGDIVPGECGEPEERRFTVTVSEPEGFIHSWHVI